MVNFVKEVEELEVFKRAYSLALNLHKVSLGFPKVEQFETASQIRRASKSICVNLAEGFAKQVSSKAEFKRFIAISLGSAKEVEIWLKFAFDLSYIDSDQYQNFRDEVLIIYKMLNKLRSSIS